MLIFFRKFKLGRLNDASIVTTFSPHLSSKLAISIAKPIRMGYKIWVEAAAEEVPGYVLHGEPYCGESTLIEKTGLGDGADGGHPFCSDPPPPIHQKN